MTEHEEPEMTMLAARSAAPSADSPVSEELFAALDALNVPRGFRAEILDGNQITVSPSPAGKHQRNVRALDRQIVPHLPDGYDNETALEIRIPRLLRSVMPDLFVAPVEVLATDDHCIPPDDVLLVAEVVSRGNPGNDRVLKLDVYARAGIDIYLLVDPIAGTTTLFTNSDGTTYKDTVVRDFGEKLVVPDPFGFDLDTSAFLPYGTPGGSTA
ncbi:Uma2 family endonuclease [Nocardiopsis trehalosi]|uniref:Uma2 family endonuclease n=1 Tax=Nocardiopsis trehalosi TaxID=109329 RepID=UPI000A0314E5|nr:Uma2 family endonuclease [Nocardiopsis trehalosi]